MTVFLSENYKNITMGLLSLPSVKVVKVPRVDPPPQSNLPFHLPLLTSPPPPAHHGYLHQQQTPPLSQRKKKRTSKHHYLFKMKKDESLKLRRLGSGLTENDVIDSSILTHLVVIGTNFTL